MSEPLPADHVAHKDFSVGFRGFDQHEVRAFVAKVAAELAAVHEREQGLLARVAELETSSQDDPDETAIEAALGRVATRVIHAAREAASELRARAEAEAAETTARADELFAVRASEADAAVVHLREDAERQAAAILGAATAERDRVLEHLATKRREVIAELERLHASRAQLVDAYETAREVFDRAVRDVIVADDTAVTMASVAPEPATAPRPAPAPAPKAALEPEPEMRPEPEPELEAEAEPPEADPEPVVQTRPQAEPEPEAEPVVQARPQAEPEPALEERRSTSLRLLRPKREPSSAAPPLSDPIESVRIIRPEPHAEAPVHEPEPTRAPDAVPAPDPLLERQPVPEPEPDPATPEPEPEPAAASSDLFARLRADRAEKVASAVAVLAATERSAEAPEPEAVEAESPSDRETTPDLALLAARDDAVVDAERVAVRSLKRALADEQNEVLDALRRLRGAPSLAALLPDPSVHDARYDAVLSAGAAAASGAAGTIAGGTPGTAADVARDLGRSVGADIRLRVDRAIEESGGDIETLAEAMSAVYREWKTSRVEPLARDAIAGAFAHGLYTAASGTLRWVVDPAEGGCPDCDDNALAGPTTKGSPYPTGQLHPPAHAGCRCVVVPAS